MKSVGWNPASPDGDVADIKVFHVVGALHVVVDHTFTCAAKRLDGVNLSFLKKQNKENSLSSHRDPDSSRSVRPVNLTHLHSRCFSSLNDGHRLSSVYSVLTDRMTVQVSDRLHWGKERKDINENV